MDGKFSPTKSSCLQTSLANLEKVSRSSVIDVVAVMEKEEHVRRWLVLVGINPKAKNPS